MLPKDAPAVRMALGEIAQMLGGELCGPSEVMITGVASVRDAIAGDIVLAENERYAEQAVASEASALIAGQGFSGDKPSVLVDNPKLAFIRVLERFARAERRPRLGIDSGARVGERLALGEGAAVGFGACLGDDVTIGDRSVVYPLVCIGDGVRIGADAVLMPNVTVLGGCEIGSRVVLHSGVVIGSDGFGYVRDGDAVRKVPQIGRVVIGDDVEIGACTTVDRAKTGITEIGAGTKIDNLVQIAHNVRIGRNCLIAAQVGIAGSSELGDDVMLAGQVGVKDHVKIGDRVVLAAGAAAYGDLDADGVYSGRPARPHNEWLRAQAALARLAAALEDVRSLGAEVRDLKKRLERLETG